MRYIIIKLKKISDESFAYLFSKNNLQYNFAHLIFVILQLFFFL